MDTLSHADWLRLHEVTAEFQATSSLDELPGHILEGMRHLVPCDSGSVQDDRCGVDQVPWLIGNKTVWHDSARPDMPCGRRVMPTWGPDLLPLRSAWLAVSAEKHPHTDYYRRTGDGSARRISEIVPARWLRQTQFFNEISRPLGINWQLTIYMPLLPGNTLALAACRTKTDFDDRDRLLLDLLRPHVSAAWRRVARVDRKTAPRSPVAGTTAEALQQLGISRREAEVLWWVSHGKTNREISIILAISPLTVKLHVERILAKLGCETRTAAARMAIDAIKVGTGPGFEPAQASNQAGKSDLNRPRTIRQNSAKMMGRIISKTGGF